MTAGMLMLLSLLGAGVAWVWAFARVREPSAVAVVAVLAMAAAAGRVLLAGLPGVEPVTAFVVVTSIVLGLRFGVSVGLVAILVSNTALGHGPWTLWQMLGIVVVALAGIAWVGLARNSRPATIAVAAGIAALGYDALLVASQPAVLGLAELTWTDYRGYVLLGLPMSIVHCLGAAAFTYIVAEPLQAALARARPRLRRPPRFVIYESG